MKLRCYTFDKKKNSTKQPGALEYISFNFVFKQPTSLLNPVLLLNTSQSIFQYNYFYIEELQTFYFRQDIKTIRNDLFELTLKLDPLATYKTEILAYTAFVERCASSSYYNVDILDSALSVEDMVEYTASASTYCSIATGLMYVVRILGRSDTGGIGTFVMNNFQLSAIFSGLWGDIDDDPSIGDITNLVNIQMSNPAQYIIGIYSSPIGASVYGNHSTNVTIYMGGHKTASTADKITSANAELANGLVLNKPASRYSDFRKTDGAFSQYYIYIPTIGTVGLAADLMDCTLTMDVSADLYSGDLLFVLRADGDVVASYQSNCYATLSIGGVNQAGSIFAGAAQAAVGLASGNAFAAIEGIKTAMSPTPTVIGSQGGTGCVTNANEIVITCVQKSSAEFPVSVYGRPCCKNVLLGNLSGYVKCGNASIDVSADETITNEINSMLNNGFYIE